MRDEARRIWKSLRTNGHIPERWGDADSVIRSYYAGEMRRFFPELQLCELDFKAHRIAINIYPAWHARFATAEETPAPAPKRSASEAPESEPAKKKPRGRKTAQQSGSADDLLPPADPTSAHSDSAVPISSLAPSASSSAPPPVLTPAPVSIAPSPSVISALQPSHSSVPPPAPPLVSPPSQSIVVPSPVDLSAATVAVNKDILPREVDSDLPLAPASGPSTGTPTTTAAGSSTRTPATTAVGAGAAVTAVNNPLMFLGDSTAPTTRADFIADVAKPKAKSKKDTKSDEVKYIRPNKTKSARNLCLIDYIEKREIPLPGKVQSDVFDRYYGGLTKEELKVFGFQAAWHSLGGQEQGRKKGQEEGRMMHKCAGTFPAVLQVPSKHPKADETIGRLGQRMDGKRGWEKEDGSAADGRVVAARVGEAGSSAAEDEWWRRRPC
ncbi:hypothetical protein K438DRAFT_1788898 [Mycena galopus ATCC 62051]|nr:hypothetical protein K438DRAFT_1788898 [Mycena galopus ATCC 62051]